MNRKSKLNILVLGGNGFIGSQIVTHLQLQATVAVGTRQRAKNATFKTVKLHYLTNAEDWLAVISGFDVVINSVGILRERIGESYEAVHTNAVAALAKACQQLDVRLIHISAIGLSNRAKSRFIRSKYDGEQAILASKARATIVRPSLLDGEGGYGAKWFRRVAGWPLQFVMQSAGLVAPLQVADLGKAVAKLVMLPDKVMPTIVELGCTRAYSIPDYLLLLRRQKGLAPAVQIAVPKWLVKIASHLFDLLNWTPLSFGHFELMQGYNVPEKNLLPDLLGRQPSELGEVADGVGQPVICPLEN